MGLDAPSGVTFAQCMDICSTTPGCVSVSWLISGGACFRKSAIGFAVHNPSVYSATLSSGGTPPGPQPSSSSTSTAPAGPTVVPVVPAYIGSYTSLGCWSDNTGGVRTLSTKIAVGNSMSLSVCEGLAATNNAQYFGVEYGTECWISDPYPATTFGTNGPIAEGLCGFTCPGNGTQYCGAGNSLQFYEQTQYASGYAVATTAWGLALTLQ